MSLSLLDFEPWEEGAISGGRIPFNNNVRRLEILVGSAISATTTAQPASPAERDVYILPSTHTGAMWSGFDEGDVVIYYNATWTAFAPFDGLRKFVEDEGEDWQYIGDSSGGWAAAGGGGGAGVTSVNGKTGIVIVTVPIQIACSDETTALATGSAKVTFRMPYAFTLTGVRASLTTAQTSGSIFTVDINEAGSTILSTKLTIDNTEKTSVTAATPPVISDSSLADDAEITIDIDQIGDGTAKGLKVTLLGYQP